MYASDVINMTARVGDKPDMLPPYRKFHGRAPFARLLPFLKPGFHHVRRTLKSEPKVCLLYTSPSPRDRQKSRMPSSA